MTNLKRADGCLRDWMDASGHSCRDVADIVGVSRAAVSKWANGHTSPSEQHARDLEELSQGAVPATVWPRRTLPVPQSPGVKVLQKAISTRASMLSFAEETGLSQRCLARWASNTNAPRRKALAVINAALKTNLRPSDFRVQA